ncbi:anti-sigma factor [Pleurocapsa sp. CCALA 161]|uniref:anti-sigma factor n=1 Tax=Pleurocapsa sp. CCALA 161 TaxID=2107688 RepID=UPI000D0505FD|nr:anti-sigma factor [Pleurocapsa sp. CCALA 161]PSB09094.1 anti-sigma factor [Pleurocapsa sp. CCALA 161]
MSTLPPECEQLLVSGYVLGNLSPAEALLFNEMLADNHQLAEQVEAMQQTLDLVYNPHQVPPPDSLRERILAVANTQQIAPTAKPSSKIRATTSSKLSKIFGAIALLTIAFLSIANYRLWRSVQTADIAKVSDQKTYLLEGKDFPRTQAKLIVNPNQLKATLIAQNLPPLPPNKVYALWTVVGKDVPYTTDQKGAILTAVFQVNKAGNFAQEVAVPQPHLESRTIKKIALTVEDISAPQNHTGSIFMATGD